ncbi:MAG: hypothetical protein HF978_20500 [Desulfobacteraceae bacterium]|nr:hypothetical protein [Desulfobacteraceae bacterium]MBC2757930.1 hypothetical protein [Desulfobacteraceae bacterium]
MPLISLSPNIDINIDKLATRLGGKKQQDFSYAVSEKITMFTEKMSRMLSPHLYYQTIKVDSVNNGEIELSGGITFFSIKLSKVMKECSEAVCFVATIGKDIDREIIRMMEQKHLSDAFVLDAIGSLLVESIVNDFWKKMKIKHQKAGRVVSLRFSPGYCDWSIEEQKKLFQFLDLNPVFVKLSHSCLMSPRKSISGIFGISYPHTTHFVEAYNPCKNCHKKDCNERRV